jgi:hypothetical protein
MDTLGLPAAVRAWLESQRDRSAGKGEISIGELIAGAIGVPGLFKLNLIDRITQDCNEYLHKSFLSVARTSCRAHWNLPPAQEEVVTAQTAPIGLDQPVKGPLDGVSGIDHSKIDRLAVGALCREQSHGCAFHDCESVLAGVSADGLAEFWMDGEV